MSDGKSKYHFHGSLDAETDHKVKKLGCRTGDSIYAEVEGSRFKVGLKSCLDNEGNEVFMVEMRESLCVNISETYIGS